MKRLIAAVVILALLMVMLPAQPVLAADGVVEVQVGEGVDDCLRVISGSSAQFSVVSPYMSVGHYGIDAYKFGNAQRYKNIEIHGGADILDAYIVVTAQLDSAGTDVESYISAEDVNNPGNFSGNTATSFDKRYANNTTAMVKWSDSSGWKKGEEYESPDISTVIQEIVDRPGWKSGNSVVIFWEDFGNDSDPSACRICYSYEGSHSRAAKLYIKYTYGGAYYEDEAGELETQIVELETQISTLNTRMAELGGMIVVFRGYVTDLGKESGLLRGGYASLHTKIAGFEASLEYIKGAVADLETETGASSRLLMLEERLGEQLEERFTQLEELESKLSGKLTLLIWLVALPLILLIAVAGYSILRRQR